MKKQGLCILLVALMGVVLVGCGGSKTEDKKAETSTQEASEKTKEVSEEDKEQEEIKGWLEASEKAIKDAGVYETKSLSTDSYDSGQTVPNDTTKKYDLTNQQMESVSQYSDYEPFTSFIKKEGDTFYVYSDIGGTWYRHPEQDADQIEYLKKEFEVPSFYSEDDYSDLIYKNEGEEDLDGTTYTKVSVTGYTLQEASTTSREQILENYGVTEEQVASIDGFSDAIDQYVEACNALYDEDTKYTFTNTIYFTTDTHLISVVSSACDESDNIAEGKEEESKVLEDADTALQNKFNEYSVAQGWGAPQDYGKLTSWTTKDTYLIGDATEAMDAIPGDVIDITYEQFQTGQF